MKKILIVIISCLIIVGVINFQSYETHSKMKQSHQFRNQHNREIGYSKSNEVCQQKCEKAGGVSCGKNWQNCCVKDQCDVGWISEICDKRLTVQGCTDQ